MKIQSHFEDIFKTVNTINKTRITYRRDAKRTNGKQIEFNKPFKQIWLCSR